VVVERHMIVDIERRLLPRPTLELVRGQRGERRSIESLEELHPARLVKPHGACVELGQELANSSVEITKRIEDLMAHPCQDPPLRNLHTDFDLGLVPW